MPFKLPFGDRAPDAGEPVRGRELPAPPQQLSWLLARGERVELRERSGAVIAWTKTKPALSAIRDPAGRLLAQIKPQAKLSGLEIANAAIEGVLIGYNPPGSGPSELAPRPPLAAKDMRSQVTFAVTLQAGAGSQVALLPGGAVNSRLIGRSLEDSDVARIRAHSPLRYGPVDANAFELRDRSDAVIARELLGSEHSTSEIDVLENPLPAAWLFAVLLACGYQVH